MNRFAECAVEDPRGSRGKEMRAAVAAGGAGENEIRWASEWLSAFLTDRWLDETECATAVSAKRKDTRCPAYLAGRREDQLEQAAEREHEAGLPQAESRFPDSHGSFWLGACPRGAWPQGARPRSSPCLREGRLDRAPFSNFVGVSSEGPSLGQLPAGRKRIAIGTRIEITRRPEHREEQAADSREQLSASPSDLPSQCCRHFIHSGLKASEPLRQPVQTAASYRRQRPLVMDPGVASWRAIHCGVRHFV